MKTTIKLLIASALLIFSFNSYAVMLPVQCVSGNNSDNCAIGESLLSVTLEDKTDYLKVTVAMAIDPMNDGGSIKKIGFEDTAGLFDGYNFFENGMSGMEYANAGTDITDVSKPVSPIPFDKDFSTSFTASSPPPVQGVNEGESWMVNWVYAADVGFGDVQDAFDAGEFRIGMHVISIQCDDMNMELDCEGLDSSEVFIATPIPGAVWLFGSALAGMVGWSRRKSKS